MSAIVKNNHRILASDCFHYSAATMPLYVFISRTTAWDDENSPPDIIDSTEDTIFAYEEIIGGKRIQSNNIISVIPRIDWTSGNVYDQYDHRVNLIDDKNPETNDFYKFYVITDEFDVYKCLNNNYRSPSTVKPSGRLINSFQTPDGYIWKFMYNIKSYDAFKFMTPNWIPCYSLAYNDSSTQWLVQSTAVKGTIDNIDVTDGGANYSDVSPPTITITGDGTGATAIAIVDSETNTLQDILVTNKGSGYTNAEVIITDSGSGVGATAIAYISPINGHGSDAREELGAIYKMIRVVFEGDEGGVLPVENIRYRKIGLINTPLSNTDSGIGLIITDKEYLYEVGDTVTGAGSGATGTIRSIDKIAKRLYLENVTGVFSQSELVSTNATNSTEVLLVEELDNLPITQSVFDGADMEPLTGDIIYFSTREAITRGLNQTEETRLVIQF